MLSRRSIAALCGIAALPAARRAAALAAQPAPLAKPETLTLGYQKVGHLAPFALVEADLAPLGVTLRMVEFARYADARTALISGSLDLATVGPADLAIALAQGATDIVGLTGVGSSAKYVIGRTGVTLNSWEDLRGKKLAIAPGSAVWFQFAATLTENNIPYNSFTAVNIQGGGANFDQALKRGEVDAIVTWEPFESIPVVEGYGFFARNLEYSRSRAVGAELGMLVATQTAAKGKKDAIDRFIWAYAKAQAALIADPDRFAEAYARFTGLELPVAREAAKPITLGGVVTPEQIAAQARAFHQLGVVPRDVSAQIPAHWDGSFVARANGA
jgi:sulfonate transport system substrate-binding protein